MSLFIVPASLEQANQYVRVYHRTHTPVLMARFCLAVADRTTGMVHGVAIVGLPLARMLMDGYTLEVRRMTTDGTHNACSILYGACWRAARAIGYRRLLTYTLPAEGGASLRAVGWRPTQGCGGHSWNTPARPREETPEHLLVQKTRWEITVEDAALSPPPPLPVVPKFPKTRVRGNQEGGGGGGGGGPPPSLWEFPEHEHEPLVTVE